MSRTSNILFLIILSFILFNAASAVADESEARKKNMNIGLGVGVSSSEYKQANVTILPLPIFNAEGRHFYLRGLTGGFHIYKDDMHEISLALSYMPQHYYADQGESHAMRRLDDRYSTLMAGPAYRLSTPWGMMRLSASADIMGINNGVLVDASYAYPFRLDTITLLPSVGMKWTSANFNDYYYGVSKSEARKSRLKHYEADDAFTPYTGVNASIEIYDGWRAFVNGNVTFLDKEVTDSPMVSKSSTYSLGAGFTYSF